MDDQTAEGPVSNNTAPEIVVVGSINLDLSLSVERFPEAGETVIGRDLLRGGGGKGANQAVAAARLGRRVAMVGRVGQDDAGDLLLRMLADEGVATDHVARGHETPSGLAVIEVDAEGENRIVVISGANAAVVEADLRPVSPVIAEVPVILTQFEIPIATVQALAGLSRKGLLIVNPAPAMAGLDYSQVDIVVPNRGELATLTAASTDASSVGEVVDQAKMIGRDRDTGAPTDGGPNSVVVTLGAAGALVVDGLRTGPLVVEELPAVAVEAVDTTAAGDAFCGGLADALCLGADVVEAARWATRVAAAAVTRRGAQASLPARSDVLA